MRLARAASKIVVARGQNVRVFELQTEAPDDDTLASHLLGPTGNLRAPTIRHGDTLYVGFSEEAYAALRE